MSEPQEIALVRHPEVAAAEGYCLGQADVPLSAYGESRLPEVIEHGRLWRPELIMSADREVCVQVANPLARRLQVEAIIDPVWRDQNHGDWEGLAWTDIRERFPDVYDSWSADYVNVAPPGGESLADLQRRVTEVLRALVARPEQRVLVVTSIGVIRTALCVSQGRPLAKALEIEVPFGALIPLDAEFLW